MQVSNIQRNTVKANDKSYFIKKFKKEADKALAKSISDKIIQLRYSWTTAKSYTAAVVSFNNWLGEKSLAESTRQQIAAYLSELSKKQVSESWLNTQVSGLKFYFRNVLNTLDLKDLHIERPKKSFPLPRILSKEEVLRMIEGTTNLKHRTLLFTLYSSGLRLGELINLRLVDIKWDRNQVLVRAGKGKKDRMVMLSEVLKETLQQYCNEYKPVHFLLESTVAGKAYSAKSIQNVVRAAAKRANIATRVTPHVLRHCFATHLHDGGISIKFIQELLGHKDIKTTMIYTHVSTSTVTSISSPLDDLMKKSE